MSAHLSPAEPVPDRILRMPEVSKRAGISVATIYRRVAAGEFPAPVSLGGKSVGWKKSDLDAWVASRKVVRP